MQSRVQITSPFGHGAGSQVLVDGVSLERLAGVDVSIGVGEVNSVRLHMIARAQDIDVAAELRIGGTVLPESVERALLVYLQAKYPKPEGEPQMVEVTTLEQGERAYEVAHSFTVGDVATADQVRQAARASEARTR